MAIRPSTPTPPTAAEEQLVLWVVRVLQVVVIGLVVCSANVALGRGDTPGSLPFVLGGLGYLLASGQRQLTSAAALVFCGAVEWTAWTLTPTPWPLPPPLASLLASTVLLATLNVVRPVPAATVLASEGADLPAWRVIVFATPLMLLMLVVLFRYK